MDQRRRNPRGAFAGLAALLWAGLLWAGSASAMPGCDGTYAATLLHPLPGHMVVGLDIRDPSPANRRLGERFLAGIHDSGVAIGASPTITLTVTISWLGGNPGGSGGFSDGGQEDTYSDVSGFNGGVSRLLPTLPSRRLLGPRTPPSPPLLFLRVDASEAGSMQILWVASVQCQMTASDDGQLAQDMGGIIGAALGQRIERRRL